MPICDQDLWKRRLQYLWRDPELALSLFQQTRYATAEILDQSAAEAWQRTIVPPQGDLLSVASLIGLYVEHVQDHVTQIARARSQ